MMTADLWLKSVIIPTLAKMNMSGRAANKLLLMTACHESGGFKHARQLGGGPALSFYQIEPATLIDLYGNYLSFRPDKKALLNSFAPDGAEGIEDLLLDAKYATAAARMIYARVPEALPAADDEVGLARYWKTYWNTALGKGTTDTFLEDWHRYKNTLEDI